MLYRVLVDGNDILDYSDPTMVLLSPQVEPEIDVAGSFEFTIPPNHKQYDLFTAENIMTMTIEVYEDNILHWFGRPVELHLDFYKNKKIYCEGGLGFFNDSVIREAEYEETLLSTIFDAVIAEHNSMVPANRQFTVGNFTVGDHTVYRKFNYEQTSDVLKSKFLDAEDGHFFVRRENGVNYIDFLKDMPYACNQQVEFAENLLNFTYSFDGKDFATCVIPLGAMDEETRAPITIKSVNNNSDILVGNTASIYGNIVKVQNYSDLVDPNELVAEGKKYLTTLQYNAFLIECSAVDLHSKNAEKQLFRVGQMVDCISNPHGINLELPISKMILYLDSAAKQITLGRIPKKTLARFYKERIGTGGSPVDNIDDTLPAGFDIITDPTTGDPSLIKVPVSMQIMTLPHRDGSQANSSYKYGDTLIFDGLTAKLVAKGLSRDDPPDTPMTYFSDANYPTGDIPFNELRFEPTTYNQHTGKLMVWCIWTNPRQLYNKITFRKAFYMQSLTEAALEAANGPIRIEIVIPPSKLDYYDGEHINLSGAKVVAYKEDGTPYIGNGYINGVIPNSELTTDPAVADIDAVSGKTEVSTAGGINAVGFTKQKFPYKSGYGAYINDYIQYVCPEEVGNGSYVGNGGIETIYFTKYNGKVYAARSSQDSPGNLDKFIVNENIIDAPGEKHTNPYSFVGGTSWHAGYPTFSGPKDDWYGITDFPESTVDPSGQTMDDIISTKSYQTVTVSWTAPNENVLTATFKINVKQGGILSGR